MGWGRLSSVVEKGKIGCLLTATKLEQGMGNERSLRKVWRATKLLWVVSSTTKNLTMVFTKDEQEEEDWWIKIRGYLA